MTFNSFLLGLGTAAEAFRGKPVDFVIAGPAEYLVITKLTDATPLIGMDLVWIEDSAYELADMPDCPPERTSGREISRNTWVFEDGGDGDKAHPHDYCSAAGLLTRFAGLNVQWRDNRTHNKPGSYHRHLIPLAPDFGTALR